MGAREEVFLRLGLPGLGCTFRAGWRPCLADGHVGFKVLWYIVEDSSVFRVGFKVCLVCVFYLHCFSSRLQVFACLCILLAFILVQVPIFFLFVYYVRIVVCVGSKGLMFT